jgi:hypothetical protein
MALTKCEECGHEVSSGAVTCPNCGHPIAAVAARRAEDARLAGRRKAGLFFLGVVGLLWFIGSISDSKPRESATISSSQSSTNTTPGPAELIDYRVVQKWSIPAGGYGHVIVVDSTKRNEPDMRRLGEQLRDENPTTRFATVEVYDDLKAAEMRQEGVTEKLSKSRQAYHDKHRIGVYNRNKGTGWNAWMMALEGMEGEDWTHIEVKY